MKISAQFALGLAIVFAVVCFGVAYDGFAHLDAMSDDAARSDARGFALFWLFLGAVGLASGFASWWTIHHESNKDRDRER